MYTIFSNGSVIYLSEEPLKWEGITNMIHNHKNLDKLVSKLNGGDQFSVCIYDQDFNKLWAGFQKKFKIIEAAGGLVKNENGDTLWIYRHDKWDLPKGKLEKHENIREAAVREVEEECGINNIELIKPLETTYHIYFHKGKSVLKITHWFYMFAPQDQQLKPQYEEDITEVVWLDKEQEKKALLDTYDNIRLVFNSISSSLTT